MYFVFHGGSGSSTKDIKCVFVFLFHALHACAATRRADTACACALSVTN